MHKSELKTHLILINNVIKEYELRTGTIGTHRLPQNQILKLTQHDTIESHFQSSALCILHQDTKYSST